MIDSSTLIQHLTLAEGQHITRQIESLRSLRPSESFAVHDVAGCVTIRSPSKYGRKLNHTVGLGMHGEVFKQDLDELEQIYRSHGQPAGFDVCDAAHSNVIELLERSNNYSVTGSITTFAGVLDEIHASDVAASQQDTLNQIEVVPCNDEESVFVNASVAGFSTMGRSEEVLRTLAEMAVHRPDTRLFRAVIDGQTAGTAGMAVIDTGVKVANLYIASSVPAFRGRKVHDALLKAQLKAARNEGCEIVMSSARTNSISAMKTERAGLKPVFISLMYSEQ